MKQNGFTLVELLSVIILLGIIAVISTTVIFKYLDESKDDLSDVEKQSIIAAAKNWATDNIELLPSIESSDVYKIKVIDLVNEGYLKEISDYSKFSVEVSYSDNNYRYELVSK